MEKKMSVEAIDHGTVIDHIPAGQGIKILKFFKLADTPRRVTIGLNLRSGEHSKKDIIKVVDTVFSEDQARELALFAPGATVNVIDNYDVVKKFTVSLPDAIEAVLACPNSNCITHQEPVASKFYIKEQETDLALKCHYCEKTFSSDFFKEL
jgi:aspartate carbamoyltransferase regulatory subunit